MKKSLAPRLGIALASLSCLGIFAASSAWATVVTWNLNPMGLEQPVGSTNHTFTEMGYSITAYGYTTGTPNTPLGLYYKNQGFDETGLGIEGPADHELQAVNQQFIQFDLGSILALGFTDGKLEIGSVQTEEKFRLFGSNTLGKEGINLGTFDSSSDLTFVDIANFGTFQFISVAACYGDVLPVAFQATINPIPEMSALFPIVGLIVAVSVTQLLRRRRMTRSISA
jgi:hypothetical protein